jgi:putative ABC transport system permease protein
VDLLLMGGGDISLASTRTLPTQAYDLWLRLGGSDAGATLFGTEVSARTLATFLAMLPAVGTAVFLVDRFFRTSLGLAMRATGDNAQMARSVGIDDAMVFIAGLAVSNGLVGLSGALFAQYQGFVTIQMSVGMLVMGLAAVAIDEGLLRGQSLGKRISGVVSGSILLRLVVALALAAGLPANTLKLVTAVLVLLVLILPDLVRRRRLTGEVRDV